MEPTSKQDLKYIEMTTKPVEQLILKLAGPSILSMLVTSVYNIVDTVYVGRISTQATAAVGICFAYMALMQAIGYFFGHGSSSYVSRALGAKDRKSAKKMIACGFFTALFVGIILAGVCFFFREQVLILLGSPKSVLPDAMDYFTFLLPGTPFIICTFVQNSQMRLQGNSAMGMIGIFTGAILNIILDPLFIFSLNMGVKGAALATTISQFTGFCMLLVMGGKRGGIKVQFKNFTPSLNFYFEILAGGIPSLFRQGLASISLMVLNNQAKYFGDSIIAAFSVVGRIVYFANATLLGLGQGFQPVCGFNYGAKLYERVKKAFRFSITITTAYGIIIAAVYIIFAPYIIRIFRKDDAMLIAEGVKILRYQSIAYPLIGYVVTCNMYFQNIRKTVNATILASARQGVFFIPAAILATKYLGLFGLQIAQPTSDVLSFSLAFIMSVVYFKYYFPGNNSVSQ